MSPDTENAFSFQLLQGRGRKARERAEEARSCAVVIADLAQESKLTSVALRAPVRKKLEEARERLAASKAYTDKPKASVMSPT